MRTWQIGQNNVPIWMTAISQKLLITVKVNALQKVSFSDTQNPKTVCSHIDSPWQAIISKTKKNFWIIFFALLKFILNFKHMPKKDDPDRWCISRKNGSKKHG